MSQMNVRKAMTNDSLSHKMALAAGFCEAVSPTGRAYPHLVEAFGGFPKMRENRVMIVHYNRFSATPASGKTGRADRRIR
jgi:hypothetical protein